MTKVSYWRQFEHGLLGRSAVRKLLDLTEITADKPGSFISLDDVRSSWTMRGIYRLFPRIVSALIYFLYTVSINSVYECVKFMIVSPHIHGKRCLVGNSWIGTPWILVEKWCKTLMRSENWQALNEIFYVSGKICLLMRSLWRLCPSMLTTIVRCYSWIKGNDIL